MAIGTQILYNPGTKNPKNLILDFVVRTDLFKEITNKIEQTIDSTEHINLLLVGQRGMGKTTLLYRIRYEIEENSSLRNRIYPISFDEEHYSIANLLDLWQYVANYLDNNYEEHFGLSRKMEKLINREGTELQAYLLLEDHLKHGNQFILLLIDNIGSLLTKFQYSEIERIKELIGTPSIISLIAGSPVILKKKKTELKGKKDCLLQEIWELIDTRTLKGLTSGETKTLMNHWAKHCYPNNVEKSYSKITKERIEILRRLSGGVIRTMSVLFDLLVGGESNSPIEDLKKAMEYLTPLYQSIMANLSSQQQRIVDIVAKAYDPIGVSEIAKKTRIPSNQVAAQLNMLASNQIIKIKKSPNLRKNYYCLRERLFNNWYLISHGTAQDETKVIWLIRFFESWLNQDDWNQWLEQFLERINEGKIQSQDAYEISLALLQSNLTNGKKGDGIIEKMRISLKNNNDWHLERQFDKFIKYTFNKYEAISSPVENNADIQKTNKFTPSYPITSSLKKSSKEILESNLNIFGRSLKHLDFKPQTATEQFVAIANAPLPETHLKFPREEFQNLLAGSISLLFEEKLAIISSLQWLKQKDVNRLLEILRSEKRKFNKVLRSQEGKDLRKKYGKTAQYLINAKDLLASDVLDDNLINKAVKLLNNAVSSKIIEAFPILADILITEFDDYGQAEKILLLAKDFAKETDNKQTLDTTIYKLANLYKNHILEYDKAMQIMQFGIEELSLPLHLQMGYLSMDKRRDLEKAEQLFNTAVKEKNWNGYLALGVLYSKMDGKSDLALEYFNKAIEKDVTSAYLSIADLYARKDFSVAKENYKKAINIGVPDAENAYAWFLYENAIVPEEAEIYAQKCYNKNQEFEVSHTLISVLIWNEKISEAKLLLDMIISNPKVINRYNKEIIDLFILLIAKNQFYMVLDYLQDEQYYHEGNPLRDSFRPIYYVVMKFMNDTYPEEFHKVTEDILQTVDEIILKVDKYSKKYSIS